ncbi:hypothetical protein AB0K60_18155 [Thermopolyspora sp. NPDC052614]|uniref:hypothetical protein n=1 Tax=Thermopolyspora sp. NPDC052614 TaxID=3155682 RepID=UPI0034393FDF
MSQDVRRRHRTARRRVRATGADPAEPIFRLEGGSGRTNVSFPTASRLTGRHYVVLVGYRGVDGIVRLDCPEVESAPWRSADFAGEESARRYAGAFGQCARRLTREGIDLTGYSLLRRATTWRRRGRHWDTTGST